VWVLESKRSERLYKESPDAVFEVVTWDCESVAAAAEHDLPHPDAVASASAPVADSEATAQPEATAEDNSAPPEAIEGGPLPQDAAVEH
jgi:hypothetical protein